MVIPGLQHDSPPASLEGSGAGLGHLFSEEYCSSSAKHESMLSACGAAASGRGSSANGVLTLEVGGAAAGGGAGGELPWDQGAYARIIAQVCLHCLVPLYYASYQERAVHEVV